MSQVAIRAALETRLNAMTPAIATARENLPFAPPVATVPFQKAFVLFATPDNPEAGTGRREIGYLQVTLQYPLGVGDGAARARADLIGAWFQKNSAFTSGGVVVTISKSAAIGNGTPDGDRWAVPVKIPFHANLF